VDILLAMYIISGLFLAALSVPLIKRRVPPNAIYGFRVRPTIENPAIWYRVNAYAGKYLLATSLATALAALAFYLVPDITIDEYALACLGIVAIMVTITIVQCVRLLIEIKENQDTTLQ
jgi:hypothetical protein